MNKQIEALKMIIDKEMLIALVLVIATWAIPIYFLGANGIWVALLISLAICASAGSEDGYD